MILAAIRDIINTLLTTGRNINNTVLTADGNIFDILCGSCSCILVTGVVEGVDTATAAAIAAGNIGAGQLGGNNT